MLCSAVIVVALGLSRWNTRLRRDICDMAQDIKGQINRMLDTLARNAEAYDKAIDAQGEVFHGRADHPLLLLSGESAAEFDDYPRFTPRQIHYDSEKMLHSELLNALTAQSGGMCAVPSVRANMGCGIVPALLGAKQELFDDKMPWLLNHLPKGLLAEMTPSDVTITPEFQVALDHMEYMAAACADYGVRVYPVDIQGAFDTAHLLLGDPIFYEMYDDPDFVHHLLDLSCVAIKLAFDECIRRIPEADRAVCHYNALAMPHDLGGVKLSEDTSTLLGAEHIEEFVKPYLHRTLAECGGGYVHYCGKNNILYQAVLDEPLAYGMNLGNPEKHSMERVIADCAVRKKVYYGNAAHMSGEARDSFFRRMAVASVHEGRSYLLLTYSCATAEHGECVRDWQRAISAI